MTRIVPAGNNKPEWAPKETKMQKIASEGQEVQEQEVDALYEAAKSVVEAEVAEVKEVEASTKCDECGKDKSCKCKEGDECKCDICKCSSEEKDVKEATACDTMQDEEAVVLDVEEVPEVGDENGEVVNEVSEAVSTEEKVEEATEKIEEAVVELKEAIGEEVAEEVGEEVAEVSEIPGEEVVDSEVIVESAPCPACGAMASDKVSMEKSASSEEFCKFAKLSPQNRQKLANYWTNMLGFPKEYVSLMTKDYEK